MPARRSQPPGPQPCDHARHVAELEADVRSLAAALITLRPRLAHHSIEQGLAAWGVAESDARRIAAIRRRA